MGEISVLTIEKTSRGFKGRWATSSPESPFEAANREIRSSLRHLRPCGCKKSDSVIAALRRPGRRVGTHHGMYVGAGWYRFDKIGEEWVGQAPGLGEFPGWVVPYLLSHPEHPFICSRCGGAVKVDMRGKR